MNWIDSFVNVTVKADSSFAFPTLFNTGADMDILSTAEKGSIHHHTTPGAQY